MTDLTPGHKNTRKKPSDTSEGFLYIHIKKNILSPSATFEAEIAVRGFIEVMREDGCEIPEPYILEKAA